MTWGLEQTNYAALPPASTPFNQALSSGLDTYQNLIQAKYKPLTTLAEAASKAAYATYSPYNQLAQIFKDPTISAMLAQNPEKFNEIMGRFAQVPTNPYSSIENMGGSKPGPLRTLWDKIQGAVTGNSSEPMSSGANEGSSNGSDLYTSQQPNGSAPSYATPLDLLPAKGDYTSPQTGYLPTTDERGFKIFPNKTARDKYISAFPNSPEALDQKTQDDLWSKQLGKNSESADEQNRAINTSRAMVASYPDVEWYEKGYGMLTPPAFTSKAQAFDKLAATASTANTRALQQGHITDNDFNIGAKITGDRSLREGAINEINAYNEALYQRGVEKQQYDANAYNKQGMRYEDAQSQWSQFASKYPLFNPYTQKLVEKNVKLNPFDPKGGVTIDEMKQQSGQSNRKVPANNRPSWPTTKLPVNAKSVEGREPPSGMTWMIRTDGVQVPVLDSRVNEAKREWNYRGLDD